MSLAEVSLLPLMLLFNHCLRPFTYEQYLLWLISLRRFIFHYLFKSLASHTFHFHFVKPIFFEHLKLQVYDIKRFTYHSLCNLLLIVINIDLLFLQFLTYLNYLKSKILIFFLEDIVFYGLINIIFFQFHNLFHHIFILFENLGIFGLVVFRFLIDSLHLFFKQLLATLIFRSLLEFQL